MLAQRIASAAVGVPVIIILIFFGGAWYVGVVAAALAVATLEFEHAQRDWLDPVALLCAALTAGIAVGAHVGKGELLLWIAGSLLVAALAAIVRPAERPSTMDVLWTVAGVSYVGFLGAFIVLLRGIDTDAREWVFLTVFSTFAVDTSAFFVGRAVGRHALAPRISPKKTVEGFLGGYAAGFIAVVAFNYLFGLGIPQWQAVLLGLLLPPVATLGDLFESALKRSVNIKDTSELIPGHGGVLDRLDSVLFVFPLVYLFTQWVVY